MFHIALVNPPRHHVASLDLPDFVDLGDISSFPPIGLMYLAQALRQDSPENRVTIVDAVAEKLTAAQTAARVKALAPDVVGLTSFTFTFFDVLETAKAIKAAGVSAPVAVGGPHMYLFARQTLTHTAFDIGVAGDGEHVFAAVCAALRQGQPVPMLPGVYRRRPDAPPLAAPGEAGTTQAGLTQDAPGEGGGGVAAPLQDAPGEAGTLQAAPGVAAPPRAGATHAGPGESAPSQAWATQAAPDATAPTRAGATHAPPGVAAPLNDAPGQGCGGAAACQVEGSGIAQIEDLNEVQIPAIDLVDPGLYYSTLGKGAAVGTICSSRGCPFKCTFCQVPHTAYRMRSVSNVADEMERYVALGITDFFFFDDLFNITKKRVEEFSREVLRRGLKVGWMFRGRVDQIDLDMMRLAVKAGCHTVSVGVEDATDEGLRLIRKNITIEQARRAVRAIRKAGARCSTNWIIGFPHHRTAQDMENLLKVAISVDADFAQFSILQCMPGSALYEQAVAEGGISPTAWEDYVVNPTPHFTPPLWEKHFPKAELFALYSGMYKRYYLRPIVFWRELLATRSQAELARKAQAFVRFFAPWLRLGAKPAHKGENP